MDGREEVVQVHRHAVGDVVVDYGPRSFERRHRFHVLSNAASRQH